MNKKLATLFYSSTSKPGSNNVNKIDTKPSPPFFFMLVQANINQCRLLFLFSKGAHTTKCTLQLASFVCFISHITDIPLSMYGEIQLFKPLHNSLFTDIPRFYCTTP